MESEKEDQLAVLEDTKAHATELEGKIEFLLEEHANLLDQLKVVGSFCVLSALDDALGSCDGSS